MKIALTDITFLMPIRLDSIQRLENVLTVTNQLCKYFNTHILLREATYHNNGILKSLLHKKIHYEFVEDKDPVLYRTKHINQMTLSVKTPYIAIWDADIVIDKKAIINSINQLRSNNADVVCPYKGLCYDIPIILRELYLKRRDIRILYRHINKMDLLYDKNLVGGAVLIKKEAFIKIGMDNESYYGWGNEDFDRYQRFIKLNYRICHLGSVLFHLSHPRSENSKYRSDFVKKLSTYTYYKTAME